MKMWANTYEIRIFNMFWFGMCIQSTTTASCTASNGLAWIHDSPMLPTSFFNTKFSGAVVQRAKEKKNWTNFSLSIIVSKFFKRNVEILVENPFCNFYSIKLSLFRTCIRFGTVWMKLNIKTKACTKWPSTREFNVSQMHAVPLNHYTHTRMTRFVDHWDFLPKISTISIIFNSFFIWNSSYFSLQ